MAPAAGMAREHTDLAVLDPPRNTGILTRDADGVCALFEKPGLIHDQHSVRVAKRLNSMAPNTLAECIR